LWAPVADYIWPAIEKVVTIGALFIDSAADNR
jgi:hypothetical protein